MILKEDHPLYPFILPHLAATMKAVNQFVPKALAEHGYHYSRAQWFTLRQIGEWGPLSQQAIADKMNRDKGAVKRMLDTLKRKGLIEFIAHPSDKRIKQVILSDQGKSLMKESIGPMQEIASSVETNLSIEEKENLIKLLAKVRANLKDNNP